jgi:hypothetical protein
VSGKICTIDKLLNPARNNPSTVILSEDKTQRTSIALAEYG